MLGRGLEPWHVIVLVAVIALLFGSKKLPDAARGLGRSMRIFKSEMAEMKEDGRRNAAGTSADRPAPVPEPLEGRVVEGDAGRASAPTERRNDL